MRQKYGPLALMATALAFLLLLTLLLAALFTLVGGFNPYLALALTLLATLYLIREGY